MIKKLLAKALLPSGGFQVMSRQCQTCIYRKSWQGTPVKELEDQVRETHRGATGFKGSRICHSQERDGHATCRGFWNRHRDKFAAGQIAQRLDAVEYVEPEDGYWIG
jgi:hypothetical protein